MSDERARRRRRRSAGRFNAEAEIAQDCREKSGGSFAANRFEVLKKGAQEDFEQTEAGDSQWRMFRKIEVPSEGGGRQAEVVQGEQDAVQRGHGPQVAGVGGEGCRGWEQDLYGA